MFWAYKKTDGHIVVQKYKNIRDIKKAYQNYDIAKIILPYESEDLKEAAIKAGNKLDSGRFLLMEIQKNGLEIPRKY